MTDATPGAIPPPEVVEGEFPDNPEAIAELRAGLARHDRMDRLASLQRREAAEYRAGVVNEAMAAGLTYDAIAEEIGCNKTRVYQLSRRTPLDDAEYARLLVPLLTDPNADGGDDADRPAYQWLARLRRKRQTGRLRREVVTLLDEQAPGWSD